MLDATHDWLSLFNKSEKSISEVTQISYLINSLYSKLNDATTIISAIFSSIHFPIYIKDNENKYLLTNDSFLQTLNLQSDYQYKGKNDSSFFTNREANLNKTEDHKILNGYPPILDCETYIPGTKKHRKALCSKIPIFNHQKKISGLIAIYADITKQKEFEKKHQSLEKIVNGIECNISIITRSRTKKGYEYNLVFANEHFKTILNGKDNSFPSNLTKLWESIIPNTRKRIIKKIESAIKFPVLYKYLGESTNSLKKNTYLEKIFNPAEDQYVIITYNINEITKLYNYEPPKLLTTKTDSFHSNNHIKYPIKNLAEIISTLKEENVDINIISKATGIPEDQLEGL